MTTEAKHTHFWEIEPAKGATSPGVCKTCGAEGMFQNTLDIDSADWIQRVEEANRRRAKMRYATNPGQGEDAAWSE